MTPSEASCAVNMGARLLSTCGEVILKALLVLAITTATAAADDFISPTHDLAFMEHTLAAARPDFDPPAGVTGITVPHHLLAADLMARGFWAASSGRYDHIIILAPDHFRAVTGPFATTDMIQQTVFGPVHPETGTVQSLLEHPDLVSLHPDPEIEHATAALLPFIEHFFPEARVTAVYASIKTQQTDWDALYDLIKSHVDERTLIVQSTDYSHFLSQREAVARDQETLAMISAADPAIAQRLHQPNHLDARAAQYLQMRLQQEVNAAQSVVIANRNSVEYGGWPDNTTSYIVTVYHPDASALSVFDYSDQTRVFFGGDLLLGRFLTPVLADPEALAGILQIVTDATEESELVANLEGVLFSETVVNSDTDSHAMTARLAVPILQNLNARALSLANNHTWDFGRAGYSQTKEVLSRAGIKALPHEKITDLGAVRIAAINLLHGREPYAAPDDPFNWICESDASPPIVAMVHWGQEYVNQPSLLETDAARRLAECGVSAVVGAHSHQASDKIMIANGRMPWVFSLGNFLFDQSGERVTSALAEVRIFEQGTIAMRLVPLPNLFDLGRAHLKR